MEALTDLIPLWRGIVLSIGFFAVMYSVVEALNNPKACGCFPMVPWCEFQSKINATEQLLQQKGWEGYIALSLQFGASILYWYNSVNQSTNQASKPLTSSFSFGWAACRIVFLSSNPPFHLGTMYLEFEVTSTLKPEAHFETKRPLEVS